MWGTRGKSGGGEREQGQPGRAPGLGLEGAGGQVRLDASFSFLAAPRVVGVGLVR